ncbi:cupredoxin domain-containing protein [Arthrobacter roseus]|uniref:cupredoxin domain-containing protein n=1 Tax=Arthrobacter roseus TaxID=136274 RepID=UPI001962B3C2|nr:cupredoxin domain-containing protein [Arthrobacter roseus]MBM7849683.1 plastocyanin [Arthrobacter roseus]
MNFRKSALPFALAAGLIGLAGCGSSAEESPNSEPSQQSTQSSSQSPAGSSSPSASQSAGESEKAEEVVITIKDFKFEGPDSIAPGATVTVVNEDAAAHTVTSEEEGLFDAVVEGNSTVTFTAPDEAGDYAYICTYHPNMTGSLVVE